MNMTEDDSQDIIELLEHKSKSITNIDDKWIAEWATLVENYFKNESRNCIRLKALSLMSQIFNKYHVVCEDELVNKIILPNFIDVEHETDSVVRKPIVHLLFDVASTCLSYKHCNAILAILRRILNKPYKQTSRGEANGLVYVIGNVDIIDSRLIISNLNKLFRTKVCRLPIEPAVNMLDISVNYLQLTYKCPLHEPSPAEIPMIRRELFSLFLDLRCNKYGHMGVVSPNQSHQDIVYSPFVICVKRLRNQQVNNGIHAKNQNNNRNQDVNQHQSIFIQSKTASNCPTVSRCINLDTMFAGIIECINQETDSDVLKYVLTNLPDLLANKPFILTTTDETINQLCLALSELIRPTTKTSRQSIKLDIVKCGLKCLTSLLIYRKSLDQKSIKVMLYAFEESLKVSRHPIVPLLTTCLIELQDSSEMAKFLPVVLNRLSKFSPTMNVGISMLEFLSYLIMFPKLYENFSQDEYKFIFAIALPYTNPFRFSDYTTCLAFRVIAMWYLNCRPSLRCSFVDFVKKSLQSNIIQPFRENPSAPLYSQTSTPITHTPPITNSCPAAVSPVDHRKRSASLNTKNCLKSQQQSVFGFPNQNSSLLVNEELIETFVDLLSRYSYGQCLAMAPKSKFTDSLVDKSASQTWLHENSLVTITSSQSRHGWAQIVIRRPTGNTIWIGKLLNTPSPMPHTVTQQPYLDSLNFGNDIISLFSPLPLSEDPSEQSPTTESGTPPSAISMSSSTLSLTSTSVINLTNPGLISAPSGQSQHGHNQHHQHMTHQPSTSTTQPVFNKIRDPVLLPKDDKLDIALKNFDHISPYETHKVGIAYVGKGQIDDRAAILANTCGSSRYYEFLCHIGTCIVLADIDPEIYFIGGLDSQGSDGNYAYFWKDNITQVIFHVATLMPFRNSDINCNNKNRHIGNNHICIVYNDSNEKFHLSTIKGTGQFITACIVITPLEGVTNSVEVEVLPGLEKIIGDIDTKVLSNLGTAIYARQLAIHLNLASKIHERQQCDGYPSKEPYVSNWVERLRCIKRIRRRLEESRRSSLSSGSSLLRGPNQLK